MAFTSSTVQPQPNTPTTPVPGAADPASMVAALLLSVYAAQKSRKQLRKLKRKAVLTFLKLRLKHTISNMFSRTKVEGISTRTLLFVLLALLVLILLLTLPPLVAIVVLIIGIILLLLYKF
jgi:hypothetical protein